MTPSAYSKFLVWWNGHGYNNASKGFTDHVHWSAKYFNNDNMVPTWYYAIVVMSFIIGIVLSIIIGSWLNGAHWINKKNQREEGKVYVRTWVQNLTFRFLVIAIATTIFMMKALDMFRENIAAGNPWPLINFWSNDGDLLFQCAFAAFFTLPIAMILNKPGFIAIIAPFTFSAAATTVFSREDLTSGDSFDGFEVHRKAVMHVLLMVAPVFMLVSAHKRLGIKHLLGAFAYTAVFNLFIAFNVWVYHGNNSWFNQVNSDDVKPPSQGEFARVLEIIGVNEKWAINHFWVFIIFIVGPLTLLIVTALWLVYAVIFNASTTKLQQNKKEIIFGKKIILPIKEKQVDITKYFAIPLNKMGQGFSQTWRFARTVDKKQLWLVAGVKSIVARFGNNRLSQEDQIEEIMMKEEINSTPNVLSEEATHSEKGENKKSSTIVSRKNSKSPKGGKK